MTDKPIEWPNRCQRPDRCEGRRECSYHLTDNDPCPHWNTIGIWEERASGK